MWVQFQSNHRTVNTQEDLVTAESDYPRCKAGCSDSASRMYSKTTTVECKVNSAPDAHDNLYSEHHQQNDCKNHQHKECNNHQQNDFKNGNTVRTQENLDFIVGTEYHQHKELECNGMISKLNSISAHYRELDSNNGDNNACSNACNNDDSNACRTCMRHSNSSTKWVSATSKISMFSVMVYCVALLWLTPSVQVFARPTSCAADKYADGCSVPLGISAPFKMEFTPACNKHDICYGCGHHYSWNRSSCDMAFYKNMKKICTKVAKKDAADRKHLGTRPKRFVDTLLEIWNFFRHMGNPKHQCFISADVYYDAVRLFAESHFENIDHDYCISRCAYKHGNPNLRDVPARRWPDTNLDKPARRWHDTNMDVPNRKWTDSSLEKPSRKFSKT